MSNEIKSERNQRICEQLKLERKQRVRTRPQLPTPRFGPHVVIPEVPEGLELHKFYGEPVLLPAKTEGEPMYNRDFTVRQADVLAELKCRRLQRESTNPDLTIYDQ